jgi:hypothetical protein
MGDNELTISFNSEFSLKIVKIVPVTPQIMSMNADKIRVVTGTILR